MLGELEPDSEVTLPRDEVEEADRQEAERPGGGDEQRVARRRPPLVDHVAPAREQLPERVDVEQEAVLVGHLVGVVEDRRRVEPDPRQVRSAARQAAGPTAAPARPAARAPGGPARKSRRWEGSA